MLCLRGFVGKAEWFQLPTVISFSVGGGGAEIVWDFNWRLALFEGFAAFCALDCYDVCLVYC